MNNRGLLIIAIVLLAIFGKDFIDNSIGQGSHYSNDPFKKGKSDVESFTKQLGSLEITPQNIEDATQNNDKDEMQRIITILAGLSEMNRKIKEGKWEKDDFLIKKNKSKFKPPKKGNPQGTLTRLGLTPPVAEEIE